MGGVICLNRTSVGLKPLFGVKIKNLEKRLNRTSVGLKQPFPSAHTSETELPQSNQRGIETGPGGPGRLMSTLPQSNQRGIETLDAYPISHLLILASIEPAWD